MKKIELEIVALSHSMTQNHSYAVVLGEINGGRRLPIVIGGNEAQAIAVEMEHMTPTRPLTHDLIKTIFETFEIELKEVVISNLQDGVFFAHLICIQNDQEIEIDSRTSDALALAVRFECPIYTYEFIIDSAGIFLEGSEQTEKDDIIEEVEKELKGSTEKTDLSVYNAKELDQMMAEAIAKEEYEKAAAIRDEIGKRKKN